MKYLEKLLEGVEVEWKPLGEVCDFQNGFAFKSNLFKESGLPIVRITNIDGTNVDLTDVKYFDSTDYNVGNPLNYNIEKGDILIAMSGATTGKIGYYNLDKTAYLNQRVGKFIPNKDRLNNRYLYHYLLTKNDFLYVLAGGGAQPNLSSNSLKEKLEIPIPPLSVQKEIVRILDIFSALAAQLAAQLANCKKQYAFYREELLTFGEDVEWKTLEEVFNLRNGYTPSKSNKEYWQDGTIPWFRMEDIRENGRVLNNAIQSVNSCAIKGGKYFPANSLIIATSATIGEHALITVPFLANQRFTNLSLKSKYEQKFSMKFLFYYTFILDEWCKNNTTISSFASVDMNGFKKFPIPIPPLAEQERIVNILDKFDALTTSMSEGLPREIELREKQYEYYRDLLLTFPKDN